MPLAEIGVTFRSLVLDLVILALGLAVYGAVFAFVGTWLKRPLVVGLVFAFGWEQVAMALPGYLRQFTVAHYLQALVPHALPSDNALSVLQSFFRQAPSAATSVALVARDPGRIPVAGDAAGGPARVRPRAVATDRSERWSVPGTGQAGVLSRQNPRHRRTSGQAVRILTQGDFDDEEDA